MCSIFMSSVPESLTYINTSFASGKILITPFISRCLASDPVSLQFSYTWVADRIDRGDCLPKCPFALLKRLIMLQQIDIALPKDFNLISNENRSNHSCWKGQRFSNARPSSLPFESSGWSWQVWAVIENTGFKGRPQTSCRSISLCHFLYRTLCSWRVVFIILNLVYYFCSVLDVDVKHDKETTEKSETKVIDKVNSCLPKLNSSIEEADSTKMVTHAINLITTSVRQRCCGNAHRHSSRLISSRAPSLTSYVHVVKDGPNQFVRLVSEMQLACFIFHFWWWVVWLDKIFVDHHTHHITWHTVHIVSVYVTLCAPIDGRSADSANPD